jgi:hypothetical protein
VAPREGIETGRRPKKMPHLRDSGVRKARQR